jgi:hypothetical protein
MNLPNWLRPRPGGGHIVCSIPVEFGWCGWGRVPDDEQMQILDWYCLLLMRVAFVKGSLGGEIARRFMQPRGPGGKWVRRS